ncbi:MAG: sulfatase [Thermomicrobiales bacterium]
MPGAPNIVYIHGHDIGRNVAPYGYAVETPAIQHLAQDGVLFRRAFSAAPTCSPSRAALLTGQSPHQTGMLGLAHRGFSLTHPERHLAAVLSSHGLTAILAGEQHFTTGDPQELGYQHVTATADTSVSVAAPAAADLIRSLRENGSAPFFLDIGFSEAHRPFHDIREEEARYVRPPAPLPDAAETRLDTAGFHASIREFDRGVGIVLDALDRCDLTANTLVICTTDHGPPFPGMKSTLTDHGLGVMLIVRGPCGFQGGRVYDGLASHLDIFPTICEVTGIERPDWLEGGSLTEATKPNQSIRDDAYGEVTFHASYEPQRTIRTDRWRYIRRFGTMTTPTMPNIDESLSRDLLLENGLRTRSIAEEELYDCLFDPAQAHNLAADPAFREIRGQLAGRLTHWMAETHDPLLMDTMPVPPGVLVNKATDLSPDDPLVSFW